MGHSVLTNQEKQPGPTRPSVYALAAVFVALSWQWATVHANFGGDWTALFYTGALRGAPASLARERIYQFPGSAGFDGQMYHYIAHDPLLRNPDIVRYVDAPRYRYRRILVPGMAWFLALGDGRRIDSAYMAVCLIWIGAGVFWSCRLVQGLGRRAAYGLAFLFLPAVLISLDRLVTDGALAALTAGFVLYCRRPSWRLALILSAAALARDTGLLLLAGYCVYWLSKRTWRVAGRYALCAVPAAALYAYVWARTEPAPQVLGTTWFSLAGAVANLPVYPQGTPLAPFVHAADLLVIAGLVLGFCLMARLAWRGGLTPENLAGIFFVCLAALYFPPHVYDSGRVYTPMLLFLGLEALRTRSILWAVPWTAATLRIGIQMAPQIAGVLRGVAHRV